MPNKEIKTNKKEIKKELTLLTAEIKIEKLAYVKQKKRRSASKNAIKNEHKIQRKLEINEIKLKAKRLKAALLENKREHKLKTQEISLRSRAAIAAEKLKVVEEKEKLKNLKRGKVSTAKARLIEKINKAKADLETQKNQSEKNDNDNLLNLKINKLRYGQENEIKLREHKKVFLDEINIEKNTDVLDDEKNIESLSENNIDSSVDITENDYSMPEDKENEFLDQPEIFGSTIQSFGRRGVSKFNAAQAPAIENDVNKFRKDIFALEMIEEFNKELPNAIRVKSLSGYMEIIFGKRFTAEEVDSFHEHAITAILTAHSIRFADGFLSSTKVARRLVFEFTNDLENPQSLVEFKNIEVGKEINILITKKLDAGGAILLANGLIVRKVNEKIEFLQNTKFMKA